MTPFVEQSPWKSPAIIDAIRLFALEEIVIEQKPASILLVSPNRDLYKALGGLCQNLSVGLEWKRSSDRIPRRSASRVVYDALPQPLQAMVSLVRHLLKHWPLSKLDKISWFSGDRALFICSYFFHLDSDRAEEGQYYSRYWEGLHDLMGKQGISGNWLHLFYAHEAVPTPHAAMKWTQRFNREREAQGFHSFVEAYLSWRLVLRVLAKWLKLLRISWRIDGKKTAIMSTPSGLSLWPLMRMDWHSSTRGPLAIRNLLWLELFDHAMRDMPHQNKGLYLFENQPWERALIHAWRKYGHGQLIAVAHSTVRFWDLRYFTDPRTVRSSGQYAMPKADLMALNGNVAVDAFLSMDYPKEAIVECEALRYGYLNDFRSSSSARTSSSIPIKVLVLGDFLPSNTIRLLRLLEAASECISIPVTYTVKPHPNFVVRAVDFPSLNLKVSKSALAEILHDFDIAYAGSTTSAAVDAYLGGLPVVVALDESVVNFSPLRGQSGVNFVSTGEELASALLHAAQGGVQRTEPDAYFFLDTEMPRWNRLLTCAKRH